MIMMKKNGNDMLINYINICYRSVIYSNYLIDYYNKILINIDVFLFYFIIILMNILFVINSLKGRFWMNRKSRFLVWFGFCYLFIMFSKLNGIVKIYFLMLVWVKEVKRLNKNVVWKFENYYKRNIMICYVWIIWKCIVEIFRYFCLEFSL